MRLKITIQPLSKPLVPINYQYPLAAAIYNTLRSIAQDKTTFLHEYGEKGFRFWTFSKLRIPDVRPDGNILRGNRKPWHFYFSGLDSICNQFANGLLSNHNYRIHSTDFELLQIENLRPPIFKNEMKGTTLSPIISSQRTAEFAHRTYLMPNNPNLQKTLHITLIAKHKVLHDKDLSNEPFSIVFDKEYLARKNNKVSKLITIKEGSKSETKVRAFECPFTISGNPDLIQTAWMCGLGESTSMGFGMVNLWA